MHTSPCYVQVVEYEKKSRFPAKTFQNGHIMENGDNNKGSPIH